MHSISKSVPMNNSLSATQVRACSAVVSRLPENDFGGSIRCDTHRSMFAKEGEIDIVHLIKVLQAIEIDVAFHHILKARAGFFENGLQVGQALSL